MKRRVRMAQSKIIVQSYDDELDMLVVEKEIYYDSEQVARQEFEDWFYTDGNDYDRWYGEGGWDILSGDFNGEWIAFRTEGNIRNMITLVDIEFRR